MSPGPAPYVLLAITIVAIGYAVVVLPVLRLGRWPRHRIAVWYSGLALAGIGVAGPVAQRAHDDFPAHVLTHLLLGMAAPALLALSAPVTLALRALPVYDARRLVRVLSSRPLRFASHIATTAVLTVGGMWVLYTTPLYGLMHENAWIGVAVQLHTLLAGYLFAAAAIGLDPAPHRPSWVVRAGVLIAAFAGHAILARSLYANPPSGVSGRQAEIGSQLMYYGGDLLEIAVIAIFCWQWFRATRPRGSDMPEPSPSPIATVGSPATAPTGRVSP